MYTQNGSSNWRFCTLHNENSNINSTLFVIVYIVIVHVDLIVLYSIKRFTYVQDDIKFLSGSLALAKFSTILTVPLLAKNCGDATDPQNFLIFVG